MRIPAPEPAGVAGEAVREILFDAGIDDEPPAA
jgi:hypothetical protein